MNVDVEAIQKHWKSVFTFLALFDLNITDFQLVDSE